MTLHLLNCFQGLAVLSEKEIASRQIAIARVLCIAIMFFVHVNPGLSSQSVVSTGDFAVLGEVFGFWLGRASVAALSFFSGYVMLGALSRIAVGTYAWRRFRTIIIPMVLWNIIYIALQLARSTGSLGQADSNEEQQLLSWVLTDATGLLVPTANMSLFFA